MNSDYKLEAGNSIGILDSGVGGLTVLKKMTESIPNEKYIYFGDTKNLPYGNKTPEQLLEFVRKILDFFSEKQVKAALFGCNTTAAVVYEKIKTKSTCLLPPTL